MHLSTIHRESPSDDPEDCLALAPYLDMFNHSPSADVEAGVDLVIRENNGRSNYQIVSNVGFERRSEVFISYGRHGNMGQEDSNRKFSLLLLPLRHFTPFPIHSFPYTRFGAYVRTTPAPNRVYGNEWMGNGVV